MLASNPPRTHARTHTSRTGRLWGCWAPCHVKAESTAKAESAVVQVVAELLQIGNGEPGFLHHSNTELASFLCCILRSARHRSLVLPLGGMVEF